ncbi:hypothetical protein AGMMS50289_19150 [Betaproteobacteria bacterium]|nr:hypothetical protein AGMMS50289_19150 [Betaproteobacteria bacterium]
MLTEHEKQELQQKMLSNQHEVYVVSFEEMDKIVKSSPKGNDSAVQAAWQEIRGKVGIGASYYATAADVVTITKLVNDLGGIGAKVYIKTYRGKPHIILKGYAGLRTIFTGTMYGVTNPKVIKMGLGRAGASHLAKQGGILTVVLLSAYRVADYFLTDHSTLSQLIGTLATDVVKVGIVTAAAIGTAIVVGAATFAIGPIVAVVIVGLGVSMLLNFADDKLGITNRVIAGLDELGESASSYINHQKRRAINAAGKAVDQIIDHAIESARTITINWTRKKLREYLTPSRRVW